MQGSFVSHSAQLHEDLTFAATAAAAATAETFTNLPRSFSTRVQSIADMPRTISKRISISRKTTDVANVHFQDIFEQQTLEDCRASPTGAKQALKCVTSEKKAAGTSEIVIANDAVGDGCEEQQSGSCSQPRLETPTQDASWTSTSTEKAPLEGSGKGEATFLRVRGICCLTPLPRPAPTPAKICPLPQPIDGRSSRRAGTNCGNVPGIEFLTPLPAGDGFYFILMRHQSSDVISFCCSADMTHGRSG